MSTPNSIDDISDDDAHSSSHNNSNISHQHSSSQLSFHSIISQQSESQCSSDNRSRNNSELSNASIPFFADMTLDLSMAKMETTPRSDLKFASMAVGGDDQKKKDEFINALPSMPLVEEGKSPPISPPPMPFPTNVDTTAAADTGDNDGLDNNDQITPGSGISDDNFFVEESLDSNNIDNDIPAVDNTSLSPPSSPDREPSFTRIGTDNNTSFHSYSSQRPTRTPRRPRDVSWTAAALLVIPFGLFIPHVYYPNGYIDRHNDTCEGCTSTHPSWSHTTLASSTHSTILFSSLAATVISFMLLRLLYSHPGGGEGDDARHVNVTRTLILSSNLCIWLNPLLVISILTWLPHVKWAIVFPCAVMARDALRVKSTGSALPRNSSSLGMSRLEGSEQQRTSHDRKTFFRALSVASLDILSRSLRRKSFVRAASVVLLVQFVCVSLWWGALSVVLSVEIFKEDSIITKVMHKFWVILVLVAGKWVTGTIAKVLGFVASGGVASWFDKQTVIIEQMEREEEERGQEQIQQQNRQDEPSISASPTKTLDSSGHGDAATEDTSHAEDSQISFDDPASGYTSGYAAARSARYAMPEAYTTADARVYASVMDFDDEGLDDDYEDDEYNNDVELGPRSQSFNRQGSSGYSSVSNMPSSTVKSFLTAACTFSFGSVAQCGLLGGLAQFLWSFVRNMDAMGFFIQRRFRNRNSSSSSGFRGMEISVNGASNTRQWKEVLATYWRKLDIAIRIFVRSHSDLALSHVAAYFKSYQRAANDVAVLIEASGVESIIHDDITTHMCNSVGHLISGLIVVFFGMLFVTHRNTWSSDPLADISILEVLLFTYLLCYTIILTVLEPLRSAIKAVYVCFAEHPMSLSQAFPLIYQRLSRISGASSNLTRID